MANYDGKVYVKSHPDTNEVFTVNTKNPEFVTFRLQSEVIANTGGLIVLQKRVAFTGMAKELAENLVKAGLIAPDKEFPLQGSIVVEESLIPFYEGQTPKINPRDNNAVITYEGMPVYRQTRFLENGKDCFIEEWVKNNSNVTITPPVNEIVGDEKVVNPDPQKV